MEQEDPFYKPKPLKLNRDAESQPAFDSVKDEPPVENTAKIFKPIERKSPFAFSNMIGLVIPIVVTAALGFGSYKGIVAFREITLRADEADRKATVATAAISSMQNETARLESETSSLAQSMPALAENIRNEARQRAESRFRPDMTEVAGKLETAKAANLEAATKKAADAEAIANTKAQAAKDEVAAAEKRAAELRQKNEELRIFLRANNRTMHPSV